MTTEKTQYRIYRAEDAGAPDLHKPGHWYYEPTDWADGEVYSEAYPTVDAARAAAREWAATQELEEEESNRARTPTLER